MYTFLHKKKNQRFIEPFFSSKCVRCTPLINMFGSKSQILGQQNTRILFSSTSLAHFVSGLHMSGPEQ